MERNYQYKWNDCAWLTRIKLLRAISKTSTSVKLLCLEKKNAESGYYILALSVLFELIVTE